MRVIAVRAGLVVSAVAAALLAFWLTFPDTMTAPLRLQKLVPALGRSTISLPPVAASLYNSFASRVTTVHPHLSNFSTTSSTMGHDSASFKDAVKNRRTIYQLTKKSPISDDRIKEIVTTAIEDVPSAFNSQSARLVVLLKAEHTKFWDIVTEILKAHVPADKWKPTGDRLEGFQNAYGTVSMIFNAMVCRDTPADHSQDPLLRGPRAHCQLAAKDASIRRQVSTVV
jgi:hypothetical protein